MATNLPNNRIGIRSIHDDLDATVSGLAKHVGLARPEERSVFIKPNFTYPHFKPGVTTTRPVIEAVIAYLRSEGYTRVCLGEGEGGYNAFSMNSTFESYRLAELVDRYDLELVNLSTWPSVQIDVSNRHGTVGVNVPRPIYEEFDLFVTIPVPKVHAMTTISGAVKNQWGLVQDDMRLRLHCWFNEAIIEINQRLPRSVAIIDGTYGLTRNGPMVDGEALELGWLAMSSSVFLADRFLARIMNIPIDRIHHLRYADRRGLLPSLTDVDFEGDPTEFLDKRFYLERSIWNRIAKLTWYETHLNHLAYTSGASSLLHKAMYSVRRKPADLNVKGFEWN